MCRDLTHEVEAVKPDRAETDRFRAKVAMAAGSISGIREKPSTAGPRSSWAVGGSAVHFDRPTKSNYTQAAMAQKKHIVAYECHAGGVGKPQQDGFNSTEPFQYT
jgi:hypothetical protein